MFIDWHWFSGERCGPWANAIFRKYVVNHIFPAQNDAEGEVLVNIPEFNVTDPDSRQFGTKGVRMSFVSDPECPLLVKEHKGYVNSNLQ